ncbi:hypothetical protein GWK47_041816 [Chionoecetes opilio]|uniref:Uncharacterized protein n=1 Tax=Chionoecetes opilio TaxID=41210 RepID=A0A8J4YNM4_CHIOP|nr:hypothetical protein GWK47_041816 [Chionoecetes opilio]
MRLTKEADRSPERERELASADDATTPMIDEVNHHSHRHVRQERGPAGGRAGQGLDHYVQAEKPEDHPSAKTYLAITALEDDNPTLKMEDEESVAPPAAPRCEGNRVLLLDPSVRRHKVVLERYPVDFPLDAVKANPMGLSATRLRGGDNIATGQRAGEVLQVPRINHLKVSASTLSGVECAALTTRRRIVLAATRPRGPPPQRGPNYGRKTHAWNPQCPGGFAGCLSLACSNSFRHQGGNPAINETRGKPHSNNSGNTASSLLPYHPRPAWVKAIKQPSPLVPRDPTPGRGSGGRESEAQLTEIMEEAATIPPPLFPPPLPKRRLGPGPAHHTETPSRRQRQREPRDVALASCHRYENIHVSEETRAIADCIIVRMMHVMRRLLHRPELAPCHRGGIWDALLLEEIESAINDGGRQSRPPQRDPGQHSLLPAEYHRPRGPH